MCDTKFEVSAVVLFLNYADNAHTHRLTAKKGILGLRRPQNVSIHQNLYFDNLTPKQYFLYHTWVRENKNECLNAYKRTFYFKCITSECTKLTYSCAYNYTHLKLSLLIKSLKIYCFKL